VRHGGRAAKPRVEAPRPHMPPPVPLLIACRATAAMAASALARHGCSSAKTPTADLACHGCSSAETPTANLAHNGCPLILPQRNKFSSPECPGNYNMPSKIHYFNWCYYKHGNDITGNCKRE
jgi:hypothetical protein